MHVPSPPPSPSPPAFPSPTTPSTGLALALQLFQQDMNMLSTHVHSYAQYFLSFHFV